MPQQIVPVPVAGLSHTFFRHNGQGTLLTNAGLTLTQPFDWLVHLDRELTSPIELLNLSAYKPHELMQQFVIGKATPQKFQQLADWGNDNTRLHRALNLFETRSRVVGIAGRVPGKVNINTIWDEPIWQSICAANSANTFTTDDVHLLWQKLTNSRTPAGSPATRLDQDRPFWPSAVPIDPNPSNQFTQGSGIAKTLLRIDPTDSTTELLAPKFASLDLASQSHPYIRRELLSKIHSQLTTRSNVFAVWMTIGYFEVTDASSRPVKLGAELGLNDGTNIRHRFFSIIDRSNLATDPSNPRLQGSRPIFFSYEPAPDATGVDPVTPGHVTAIIPAISYNGTTLRGSYDDSAWELQPNDRMLVDTGLNQESVPVQIISFTPGVGAKICMSFNLPHSRGCSMMIANTKLGNPGPQPGFNVRDQRYSGVVRFFAPLD